MVDYDPVWPKLFQAEAARLSRDFPQGCIRRIEHIGITAVPGLAAKPIVDILLGVDDFGPVVANVAPAMEEAGYDYLLRRNLTMMARAIPGSLAGTAMVTALPTSMLP